MKDNTFRVTLTRRDGYEFAVRFDSGTTGKLTVDQPPPLGEGAGPNPTALLGAAVGSCLAASLLFCLQKARVPVTDLETEVSGTIERNEAGRLRVSRIAVRLAPELEEADAARITRCIGLFEDFCTVTQSVRQGIDIDVVVEPKVAAAAEPMA